MSPIGRRRLAGAVLGALAILALVSVAPVAGSTPVTDGYRDFGYGGGGASRATADKPQSKLWYAGGAWWGGLFLERTVIPLKSEFHIFKLVGTSWADTGIVVDTRDRSHADYLFDGAANKLYVASAHPAGTVQFPDDSLKVYRFSFHSGSTPAYTLDPGFPVAVPSGGGGQQTVTIAKDSTGDLWLTWPKSGEVKIAHSVAVDDGATWSTPFQLPVQTDPLLEPDKEITAITAFGDNKIGVMWSLHHEPGTAADAMLFAVHHDGDAEGTWDAAETATSGIESSDNHINLKTLSDGRVLAVTKTAKDTANCATNSNAEVILLLERSTGGSWTKHVVSMNAACNTRPQLALDEELGVAYVFMSAPNGGGTVYYKSAPLSDLTFAQGPGTPFIKSALDTHIDDATTSKQNVDHTTGLVVEASDAFTDWYLHNALALPATDATPPAGTISVAGGATFTGTLAVSVDVTATDAGGSGLSQVRLANDGSVDGSGVLNGAGATSFAYTTPAAWTLPAGDGAKTVYAQWRDSAGNWSGVSSDAITLDQTGPAGAVSIDGGALVTGATAATLDVTATDAGVGIVANVRIANAGTTSGGILSDASAVTRPYAAAQPWTLPAGEGTKTVYVQWQDSLGYWSGVASDTIDLDQTAPGPGTVVIDGGAVYATSLSVNLALTNPGAATQVRAAESPLGLSGSGVAYSASLPFNLAAGLDGTRTAYVQWGDDAGNWSSPATDTINLDIRHPVGTVAINGGAVGTHSLAVSLSFPSTDTDIDTITVSNAADMSGAATFGTTGTIFSGTVPWTLAGSLTNGATKTVYVKFHDLADNTSDSTFSDAILVDLTKPVARTPVLARFGTRRTVLSSGVPVYVSWPAASDTVTGVGSYRLQASIDRHAYVTVATTVAPAATIYVRPGHLYRLRVAAIDRAGNVSLSVYGAYVKVAVYQERSLAIRYSAGWHLAASTLYYGGYERWSKLRGASARLTFYGRSIAWVAPRSLARGTARVYIDGRYVTSTSLWSSVPLYRQMVFSRSWTRDGYHTIRIVVLGTAGHPRVDLDAFTVLR